MSKQKWGELVPHVETAADGSQRWLVAGEPVDLPRAGSANEMPEARAQDPKRWDEVPAAAYNAIERLKAMDTDGVDYSVLYPTIGGMAGERFGRLDDIELETACVQAYNDWLIEEWAARESALRASMHRADLADGSHGGRDPARCRHGSQGSDLSGLAHGAKKGAAHQRAGLRSALVRMPRTRRAAVLPFGRIAKNPDAARTIISRRPPRARSAASFVL